MILLGFAKLLQVVGLLMALFALYYGVVLGSLGMELMTLMTAALVFMIGRSIEPA